MTFDDAQKTPDAAETPDATSTEDDFPTGMLASPTRIQL